MNPKYFEIQTNNNLAENSAKQNRIKNLWVWLWQAIAFGYPLSGFGVHRTFNLKTIL